MHPNDGRVVSNFIIQSLQALDLTVYGDGSQTRSFQFVSDLVNGLYKLMEQDSYDQPVNLGNPDEYSILEFAQKIQTLVAAKQEGEEKPDGAAVSKIVHLPATQDDPLQRKPDITTAKRELGWEPTVSVDEGLEQTIAYFATVLKESNGSQIVPTGPGAEKPRN